jgi:hypothetical protein
LAALCPRGTYVPSACQTYHCHGSKPVTSPFLSKPIWPNTAFAAEEEQVARVRVATEPFLDQERQAVHALAVMQSSA